MEPKEKKNPTKIIPSSDIGPVPINHPGAIYKSRPLSDMIQSVISSRYSRSQSINLETDKEKVEDNLDNLIEDNNDNGQNIKRKKSSENENNDYITKEIDFELDINLSFDHL
ncbi:hypothetical protein C1645_740834 [Glomus cerebriforme]|uniref:Uncharacterized protein n=1 Tax=Glomus cerebriforme TaxID=658196 RepID=A0A397SUR1_9GLOM|nr:hypothetical protein C1645_740834 [Glomus cerebriforme]